MKKIYILLAALCCAMTVLATNVGDTITYAYQGNTLWYKVSSSYCSLVPPCTSSTDGHYWGTNTQPSGVVYVPDSVPVDGVMTPVTYCNDYVFYGLKNVTEVHLNNRISTISRLFNGCSIETLYLGQSLDNLGYGSLSETASLERVILASPDQLISVAWNAFTGSKMYLAVSKGYFCLGKNAYSYRGAVVDSTLTLPDTILHMGGYFGYRMSTNQAAAVRNLALPASLTLLNNFALYNMVNLRSVTCSAPVPPTVYGSSFYTTDNNSTRTDIRAQATLYVPWTEDHSVLAAYRAADGWKDFSAIEEYGAPANSYDVTVAIVNGHMGRVTVNGQAVSDGSILTLNTGESVTVVATPAANRLIDYVRCDGAAIDTTGISASGAVVEAALSADHTLTIAFSLDPENVQVNDTIPYYYMGDTLWYQVYARYVKAVLPTKTGYGSHTQPSGVVYVPDSVPVNGVKRPVLEMYNTFDNVQTIDEVYLNHVAYTLVNLFFRSSVKKVHILNPDLKSFNNGVFKSCTQLDSVFLTSPDQFLSSAWDTWLGSKLVTSLNNDFLRLGNGVYAYKGFPADSTLVLPDGVKFASTYLTYPMGTATAPKLRAIVLPASMTQLSANVFYQCTGIQSVTCMAPVPPTVYDTPYGSTFFTADNSNTRVDIREQATLYVPWTEDHSIVNAYRAADGWKNFTAIVEIGAPTYNVTVTVDGGQYGVLNINGMPCSTGVFPFSHNEELTITPAPTSKGLFVSLSLAGVDRTADIEADGQIVISALTQDTVITASFAFNPDAPVVVGDTIPYYYMGDTLWYQVNANYLRAVRPTKTGYGSHTQPSGVVYVPDSVPVNGVMKPVLELYATFKEVQTIDEVYLNHVANTLVNLFLSSSVKKVHILNPNLTSFNNGVFENCTQLDSVILTSPDQFLSSAWDTWVGSKLVTSLNNDFLRLGNGVYAYKGFPADSTLVLPDGVKFASTYLTFPMGNTTAAKLRAAVLPASMTQLSANVFYYCTGIQSVTCMATVPPTVYDTPYGSTFFTADNASTRVDIREQSTLYVPWSPDHSVLAAYRAADGWKTFSAIVELPIPVYRITFTCDTLLQADSLTYGEMPVYAGATPVKDATAQYTYTFKGWDPEIAAVTGDADYVAQFDSVVNTYVVTFLDHDGTVLLNDTVAYGSGATAPADPVREGYLFTGWSDDFSEVTADMSVEAQYELLNALDALDGKAPAVKFFRDGHLYIRRDGVEYDAAGRRVE